jgi:aryl-alcohol dehydrogenase-like predicted oxidoreductase
MGGAAISGEGGGYGFGSISEIESEKLLKSAFERGIRLFDTAPIYGFGLSEERMGKYLPEDAFIVTKGGVHWHENKRVDMSNDPKIIEEMLLASFKRLNREQIDLYMIHWPDSKVDIRKTLEVVKKYQDQGKIRSVGLCNTFAEDLRKAQEVCRIDAVQSEFNLFRDETFQNLSPGNFFTMGWGTLDKGILSGRVHSKRSFEADDCRSWAPWWNKKEVLSKVERVERFLPLLQTHGITLKHFAIQFALQYGVKMTLVGSKTTSDLDEMINLSTRTIGKSTMETLVNEWRSLK